jgi:hypothetical protein
MPREDEEIYSSHIPSNLLAISEREREREREREILLLSLQKHQIIR